MPLPARFHPMSKRRREHDPFREIREWQDHRLDPGYFTGGRIHPLYRSGRPNRSGWVLIVFGGLTALSFPWLLFNAAQPLGPAITVAAVSALQIVAGVRLVRGSKKRGAS